MTKHKRLQFGVASGLVLMGLAGCIGEMTGGAGGHSRPQIVPGQITYQSLVRQIQSNVSGDYMMLNSAAKAGLLDKDAAMMEMLYSIKRAGANIIITYFAKAAAKLLNARTW